MLNNRIYVPVESLKFNEVKKKIYLTEPLNYMEIKNSIRTQGILEDIIVDPNTMVVISGNIRLQIAKEIGIKKVPVVYRKYESNIIDLISIHTNHQRQKSMLELSNEIEFIYNLYPVGQGARSDKNETKQNNKKLRKESLSKYSDDKIEKLISIKNSCKVLSPDKWEEIHKNKLTLIDEGRSTLNGIYNSLKDKVKNKKNSINFPNKSDLIRENIKIYNHSSETMPEVQDKSVDLTLTSPPFFEMVDYSDYSQKQKGEKGLGWGCIDKYFECLINTFIECKRVLKDNGSLVVNINDSKNNGFYNLVPERLVLELDKIGFSLVDTYIWLKVNPQYYNSKGAVRSHEYIYHFVKKGCHNYFYDNTWLEKDLDEYGVYKYGKESESPKLFSGFDPRLKVLKTNVADTKPFKKKCEENGLYFYNHGTFMEEIPHLFLKTLIDNSKPGVVLDPYAGSSTVGKVANELGGHSFIGYEVIYDNILASELKIFGDFQDRQLRQVA